MRNALGCPTSLDEAVLRGLSILNASDIDAFRSLSLQDAEIDLHLTLGHHLRSELGLWGSDTSLLFDDMNAKMSERLVVDADTASGALIELLWHEVNKTKR
jgi:hypothetical protein